MRIAALMAFIGLVACTPRVSGEPTVVTVLEPYSTVTPAASPGLPEGALVSPEAPLPTPTPFSYTVKSGDTLGQIAEKYRISLDALMQANPGVNPNAMTVGHVLKIPGNAVNPSGEMTPSPVPFPVQQIGCDPAADGSLWCFVLIRNDGSTPIENITAQVTLLDHNGAAIASQVGVLPLDVLAPDQSLPLSVFFRPGIPLDARPQVQILTAIRLLQGDPRYLPAAIGNTAVEVAWSGLSAQVSGQVALPADSKSASQIWVVGVAYDGTGRAIGVQRWESNSGLGAGGTLPFSFMISSAAGKIERVDFAVEARP